MSRHFLYALASFALLGAFGCDRATSSTPQAPATDPASDSSALLRGNWLRVDSSTGSVQTMRLLADQVGRLAEWDSGKAVSQVRFSWSLQKGLLVRSVDSGSPNLPATVWNLRGDSLVLGTALPHVWTRSLDAETRAAATTLRWALATRGDTGKVDTAGPLVPGGGTFAIPVRAQVAKIWMTLDDQSDWESFYLDFRAPSAIACFVETEAARLACQDIGPWSLDAEGQLVLASEGNGPKILIRHDSLFMADDSTPFLKLVPALPDLPRVDTSGTDTTGPVTPVDTSEGCVPSTMDARLLGEWVPVVQDTNWSMSMDFQSNGSASVNVLFQGANTSVGMDWGTRGDSLFLQTEGEQACQPGGLFKVAGDTLWFFGEDGPEIWVRPGTVVEPGGISCPGFTAMPELVGAWSMVPDDSLLADFEMVLQLADDGRLLAQIKESAALGGGGSVEEGIWSADGGRILLVGDGDTGETCADALPYRLVGDELFIEETRFRRLEAPIP